MYIRLFQKIIVAPPPVEDISGKLQGGGGRKKVVGIPGVNQKLRKKHGFSEVNAKRFRINFGGHGKFE